MISSRFVLDFLVCFVSLLWEGLIRYGEEFDERGRRKKKCDENECERETGESERACDYI